MADAREQRAMKCPDGDYHECGKDGPHDMCSCVNCGAGYPNRWATKGAAPEPTPHSSVINTDLRVKCNGCGGYQIWRYLEDEDTIEVFHDCTAKYGRAGVAATVETPQQSAKFWSDPAGSTTGECPRCHQPYAQGEHFCYNSILNSEQVGETLQPASEEQERENFETWYEAQQMPMEADWFRRVDADGDYFHVPTQSAWEGWSACLRLLRQKLEQAERSREHTQDWYARHYGKVEDWARKRLPEPWRTEFFHCVANGTWGNDDLCEPYMSMVGKITPSGYFVMDDAAKQLLSDQTVRAEQAERERDTYRNALYKYGNHEVVEGVSCCAVFDGKPCNCGFKELLQSGDSTRP